MSERHALPAALLHDLRTPLGHIIGYAELLEERAREAGDERFAPDLRKVGAAGYRMLALIEESFTVARPAAALTWDDVDMLAAMRGHGDVERMDSLIARLSAALPPRDPAA